MGYDGRGMAERAQPKQRLLLLVLLFAPLFPLWRCVIQGESIGAFDQIRQFAPWNQPTDGKPWDVLQADSVLQFYPWRQLVFESWSNGRVPFWNPYELAGTPLLANSQSGALYPLHILFGMLQWPTATAMFFLAWIHLAWAGLGVYSLTRQYGARRTAAIFAGLTFSLSPFMLAWTSLPSVISTVSWIPWVLVFVVRSARAEERRGRVVSACLGSLSVAMMILAGHLQFAAYGFMAAIIVVLVETFASKPVQVRKRRRRSGASEVTDDAGEAKPKRQIHFEFFGRCVLFLAAGAALAAPQLLPVLEYSKFSHRRAAPSDSGYQAYVGSAIKPYALGNLAFGTLNGDPAQFPAGLSADGPQISSYWPILDPPAMPYAESALALGPLALALLFLAPWRQKRRGMTEMAALGIASLLLALGTPLNYLLYFGVPGWSATGSPGRIIVLFVLAVSVISGVAIDRLSSKKHGKAKNVLPYLLPGLVLIPCLFFSNINPLDGQLGSLIDSISDVSQQAAIPLMVLAALASALAIFAISKIDKPIFRSALLLAPVLICMLQGGGDLIRTGHPASLTESGLTPKEPYARVAVINQAWGIPIAAHALIPGNILSGLHIHELSGYDSLLNRDTVEMLRDIDGKDPAPEANGNMMFIKPSADPVKLAEAGVTEVWSIAPAPQFGEPFATVNGFNRYHLNGPGRASTPNGPATIMREDGGIIRVKALGPGRLVLRERNMPGWSAVIDAEPVEVRGDRWLEVDLPAGEQVVTFHYVAPGYGIGLILFLVAGAGIVALLIPRFKFFSAGSNVSGSN